LCGNNLTTAAEFDVRRPEESSHLSHRPNKVSNHGQPHHPSPWKALARIPEDATFATQACRFLARGPAVNGSPNRIRAIRADESQEITDVEEAETAIPAEEIPLNVAFEDADLMYNKPAANGVAPHRASPPHRQCACLAQCGIIFQGVA